MWPVAVAMAVVIFLVAAAEVQMPPKPNPPTVASEPSATEPAVVPVIRRPVDNTKKAGRGKPCSCLPRLY